MNRGIENGRLYLPRDEGRRFECAGDACASVNARVAGETPALQMARFRLTRRLLVLVEFLAGEVEEGAA